MKKGHVEETGIVLGFTFRFNTKAAKEKGGAISGEAGFEGKEF